jgi:hypothetical protein
VLCRVGRRTFQGDNAHISWIKLEAILKVLPDQHRSAAREPKLLRGDTVIPIAFDNNGTLNHGIAVLAKSHSRELGFSQLRDLILFNPNLSPDPA